MKPKFIMYVEDRPVVYRERTVVRKGFVSSHRTPQLKVWQETLSLTAKMAMKGRPKLAGPLRITFMFHYKAIKKSLWGAWRTKRPDLTNLEKAIEDALQGVWYDDDSHIASKISTKKFGSRTGVEITVEEI